MSECSRCRLVECEDQRCYAEERDYVIVECQRTSMPLLVLREHRASFSSLSDLRRAVSHLLLVCRRVHGESFVLSCDCLGEHLAVRSREVVLGKPLPMTASLGRSERRGGVRLDKDNLSLLLGTANHG